VNRGEAKSRKTGKERVRRGRKVVTRGNEGEGS